MHLQRDDWMALPMACFLVMQFFIHADWCWVTYKIEKIITRFAGPLGTKDTPMLKLTY